MHQRLYFGFILGDLHNKSKAASNLLRMLAAYQVETI